MLCKQKKTERNVTDMLLTITLIFFKKGERKKYYISPRLSQSHMYLIIGDHFPPTFTRGRRMRTGLVVGGIGWEVAGTG